MQLIEGYDAARSAIEKANAERAPGSNFQVQETVRNICAAVWEERDAAVLRLTRQFDCPTIELGQLRVGEDEIEVAWKGLAPNAQKALTRAAENIEYFHRRQPVGDWFTTSPDGVFLGQRLTPVQRVAMYAPHARAAYPSSVLMLAIPARVAGVHEPVLATPADKSGNAHPVILAAAHLAGIREIYKLGGAVAVAALAYGTDMVRPVHKIVGPGNSYFSAAKQHVAGTVGIDGFYGPSDVVIVADAGRVPHGLSDEEFAAQLAADLLAQAEHEPEAWVCLATTSRELAEKVQEVLQDAAAASPRAAILHQSLQKAVLASVASIEEACALANLAASEHLEIWSQDALALSTQIRDAGAIFLNTPVPLGDYIAGPSHTLPTGATARFSHGISVETFLKRSSIVAAPPSAVASLAEDVEVLATLEELPGHAAAVRRVKRRGGVKR